MEPEAKGGVSWARHGGTTGRYRVYRGGSWNSKARNVRAAYRNNDGPSNRNDNLGFRPVSSRYRPDAACLRMRRQSHVLTKVAKPVPAVGAFLAAQLDEESMPRRHCLDCEVQAAAGPPPCVFRTGTTLQPSTAFRTEARPACRAARFPADSASRHTCRAPCTSRGCVLRAGLAGSDTASAATEQHIGRCTASVSETGDTPHCSDIGASLEQICDIAAAKVVWRESVDACGFRAAIAG